ncbi:hypothetical protein SV7mr_11600 [Stieleria bergensis]|uniref:Uncharacterized protein n=1 Tax=Stieleria bergensis TaxID=2528025 RepID=A0A517SRB9_9BACT|nr:hypothetical protein SV7mr_11600 [Planctomycetes bacterium SV_7m_r]
MRAHCQVNHDGIIRLGLGCNSTALTSGHRPRFRFTDRSPKLTLVSRQSCRIVPTVDCRVKMNRTTNPGVFQAFQKSAAAVPREEL